MRELGQDQSKPVLDLTKPLNAATEIYGDSGYSDPPFTVEPWCDIDQQGFRVARLALGTQTGTHIDAPAHFSETGATLESLDPSHLVGAYFLVTTGALGEEAGRAEALSRYAGEPILFVLAGSDQDQLPEAAVEALIALGCTLWAVAGGIEIIAQPALAFHRWLAENDIYLVEDLDEEAARQVPAQGTLIALPLRLEGVSGSPCRVLVLPDGPLLAT